MGLSLPKSCGCISLRAACILIGLIVTILSTLMFVYSVSMSIVYHHRHHANADVQWTRIAHSMAYLYTTSAQIIFSGMLVYGSSQEVSCYTLSWLICELGVLITAIVESLFWVVNSLYIFLEDLIVMALLVIGLFIVFSYYTIMKKPVAI